MKKFLVGAVILALASTAAIGCSNAQKKPLPNPNNNNNQQMAPNQNPINKGMNKKDTNMPLVPDNPNKKFQ